MWNAGVIGLTDHHLTLLDKVLNLTDKLYDKFKKHTVEQFAFNYIFQKQQIHISPAQSYIFHYWNLKEFRKLLVVFLKNNKNLESLLNLSDRLSPENIVADKMKSQETRFIKKMFLSLSGNKWNIDNYKF